MTYMIPIAVANLAGLACLFYSWRSVKAPVTKITLSLVGWFLLSTALAIWIVWQGPEFGTMFGITAPSIVAIVLILINRRYKRPLQKKYQEKPTATNQWRRHSLRIVLSVFIAGIVSFVNAIALGLLISDNNINALVIGVTVGLLAWGILAFVLTAMDRIKLILGALTGITALSLGFLFL